jgi:hypothetical protein
MMSAPAPDPQKLLEQFVVNNADLERLESLLNQFNIFEAVGMVRQEIHHSRFLAFLLNPNASHHLGDVFLKTFLKRLLLEANNATVSPIEIDVATLTDTEVRREWKNKEVDWPRPQSHHPNIGPTRSISNLEDDVQQFWDQFLPDELSKIDGAIVQAFGTSA